MLLKYHGSNSWIMYNTYRIWSTFLNHRTNILGALWLFFWKVGAFFRIRKYCRTGEHFLLWILLFTRRMFFYHERFEIIMNNFSNHSWIYFLYPWIFLFINPIKNYKHWNYYFRTSQFFFRTDDILELVNLLEVKLWLEPVDIIFLHVNICLILWNNLYEAHKCFLKPFFHETPKYFRKLMILFRTFFIPCQYFFAPWLLFETYEIIYMKQIGRASCRERV